MPAIISGNYMYAPVKHAYVFQERATRVPFSGRELKNARNYLESEGFYVNVGSFSGEPANLIINVSYTLNYSSRKTETFEFRYGRDDGSNKQTIVGEYLICHVYWSTDSIVFDTRTSDEISHLVADVELTGYSREEARVRLIATELNWDPGGTMLSIVSIGGYNLDVVDAEGCFENATFVTKVANLSSKLINMNRCFKNCYSLSGNIKVSCEPEYFNDIFTGTYQPIYIINDGLLSWNVWRGEIVGSYGSNIHYEAEDNPRPIIQEFTLRRTNANGGTSFDPTGKWAYIRFIANVYRHYIPDGWTNALSTISLTMNNAAISPTWTKASMEYSDVIVYTYEAWVQINTEDLYTFSIRISEQTKNESGTVKRTINSSYHSLTLSRPYALVDYYNDNATNKQGIAFGKYAAAANLFDVNMPTILRDKLSLELNDNVTSGTDSDLIKAIDALGWGNILS